jgi:hypothetical protein
MLAEVRVVQRSPAVNRSLDNGAFSDRIQRYIKNYRRSDWKVVVHMECLSQIATENEIRRLKLEVVAHQRHIGTLRPRDPDMLRLLRAEKYLLRDAIARLKRGLVSS